MIKLKKIYKGAYYMDDLVMKLTAQTADIALRNTAAAINTRIQAVKEKKQDKETIAVLEEIINKLVEDKNALMRVINAYEQEFVTQKLTSADMDYIVENVVPAVTELAEKTAKLDENNSNKIMESLEIIKPIVSKETLNILQLLGFNFKKGIGEPLTDKTRMAINKREEQNESLTEALARRDEAWFNIISDPEAYHRYLEAINKK